MAVAVGRSTLQPANADEVTAMWLRSTVTKAVSHHGLSKIHHNWRARILARTFLVGRRHWYSNRAEVGARLDDLARLEVSDTL